MNSPSGHQVMLTHSDQELVVVEVGGGIRSFRHGGADVLDGYAEDQMCSGGRGQILAPWPNRLGDGRFDWSGRTYQLALTEAEHHNAIHGLVRWANWHVEALDQGRVRAAYRLHPQPGWGWILDLVVTYRLSASGLEVTTEITNAGPDGAGSCPVGVGWHPYLAAFGGFVDETVLAVPARAAYRTDERSLPVGRYPVAGTDADFTAPRPIGAARLDTAFTDLERDAEGRAWVDMATPGGDRRVRMWMDGGYTHLMVFTGDTLAPERRRLGLAVEPMTCAPDAFRSGDGLRTLGPGETLTATWGLSVRSDQAQAG